MEITFRTSTGYIGSTAILETKECVLIIERLKEQGIGDVIEFVTCDMHMSRESHYFKKGGIRKL